MNLWRVMGLFALTVGSAAAEPVLRGIDAQSGRLLLRNGDFRHAEGEHAADWQAYESGYRRVPGGGRGGSDAILCENAEVSGRSGASQTVLLKQKRPIPLLATAWSRAENVSGTPDANYSLYLDLVYADGTPLWGRIAPFRTGSHDWEQVQVLVVPEKPVERLTLHCLFRGHSGRVWFSEVSLLEMAAGPGGLLFDGKPVQRGTVPRPSGGRVLATQNGLALRWDEATTALTSVRLGGRELMVQGTPSGFLARDVAAGPAVYSFRDGKCQELGLSLQVRCASAEDHLVVDGQVRDETGKDRAITLFFVLPFPRGQAQWHDDARRARLVSAGEYINAAPIGSGSTGTMSRYPWACVTSPVGALGLGIDMDRPAQFRLFYNADLQALVLAYDFGLVKETRHFPSGAPFRFVLFPVEAAWGFRSAAECYQRIFAPFYVVRSKEQGIWMPFTDVSTVQGWQDFGFRYHEGDNNVPFDDNAGILSFKYTEPATYWMRMPPEMPRTREAALAELQRLAKEGRPQAIATLHAGIYGPDGQIQMQIRKEPWCDGAVWSLCALPEIEGEPNGATLHWNEATRSARYGPNAKGVLDGEYLDSLEGYVTADLNFRREHFAAVNAPLTFHTTTHQPAIHKGLAVWEFTRWVAKDVHAMGKLMFANGVPYRFSFLTGYLDIMGTEMNWLRGNEYRPPDDATLLLFRTLSGAKPYLILMNTNYDLLVPELVERYFQRCLFYGIYPSMFSHNASENPYWRNPNWYNRDRHLFKRYIPVIRRVAEAGWRPVTLARCEGAWVERFGPATDGTWYFTLLNATENAVEALLHLQAGAPEGRHLVDLLSGERFAISQRAARIPLGPDQTRALQLEP